MTIEHLFTLAIRAHDKFTRTHGVVPTHVLVPEELLFEIATTDGRYVNPRHLGTLTVIFADIPEPTCALL